MTTVPKEATATDAQAAIRAIRKGEDDTAVVWLEEMRLLTVRTAAAILRDRDAAEDISQAALLNLVSYIRDVPREIRNPPGLAVTIARNLSIARIRSRTRRRPPLALSSLVLDDGTTVELASEVAPPDEQFEQDEQDRIIMEAVHGLKPQYQQVLRGLYWDGLTKKSVADTLRISVRTVHNIRERALVLLTRRLRKKCLPPLPDSGVREGERDGRDRGGHED